MKDPKIILLVEDNPDDEALTLRALRKNNILNDIIVARDGAEALDLFFGGGIFNGNGQNVLPAVVILDLKLPKVDGLDVLKRLRSDARTKIVPVVVLTSSNDEQDILNSYGLGANSFIRKPVDFIKFVEVASNIGLYWLVMNESPVRTL
jgi:CheY-like chemotaxis protein